MQCSLFFSKSFEITSINPSAVNGAWGKINRLRLLWCACPVKTTCVRVCAFCITHVWWSVSMPVQCTRIILILTSSPQGRMGWEQLSGLQGRRITEQRGSRGFRGRMRRVCERRMWSVLRQGFIVLTRRMRVVNCAWLRGSQRHQSRSVKFLPNGSRCVERE